jgi:hypothetical protein
MQIVQNLPGEDELCKLMRRLRAMKCLDRGANAAAIIGEKNGRIAVAFDQWMAAWMRFLRHEGNNTWVSPNDESDSGLGRSFCPVCQRVALSLGAIQADNREEMKPE